MALACQCGVRMAPGLSSTRLIDRPLRIGRLSAVTRRIEPRSDSSTISPSSRDRVWVLRVMDVVMAKVSWIRAKRRVLYDVQPAGPTEGLSATLTAIAGGGWRDRTDYRVAAIPASGQTRAARDAKGAGVARETGRGWGSSQLNAAVTVARSK